MQDRNSWLSNSAANIISRKKYPPNPRKFAPLPPNSKIASSLTQKQPNEGLERRLSDIREWILNFSWKLNENIAYMNFLKANEALFSGSKIERKYMKINMLMIEYIKSRSPAQCRSHHQKMAIHHGDIQNIVRHVERFMTQETAGISAIAKPVGGQ